MSRFVAKRSSYGGTAGRSSSYAAKSSTKRGVVLATRRAAAGSALVSKLRNRYPKLSTRGWLNNNQELKYVDTAFAATGFNTTGSVNCVNLLAVGDDNTTRDGRQIVNKSLQIQGMVYPQDDTTVNSFVRYLVVWDAQPNSGAIATPAQILTSASSYAFTNLDNRERFTILKDRRMAVGRVQVDTTATQSYGIAVGPGCQVVNEYIDLKALKTIYSGTTAAIGSIATGALLLFFIGDTASGTSTPIFVGTTRLRFTD